MLNLEGFIDKTCSLEALKSYFFLLKNQALKSIDN